MLENSLPRLPTSVVGYPRRSSWYKAHIRASGMAATGVGNLCLSLWKLEQNDECRKEWSTIVVRYDRRKDLTTIVVLVWEKFLHSSFANLTCNSTIPARSKKNKTRQEKQKQNTTNGTLLARRTKLKLEKRKEKGRR